MDIGAPIGTPPTLPSDVKLAELTLNRGRWHQPRVAVIIVHFDYADFLEDAIVSVIDQSYRNVECVVVDDGSSPAHRRRAEEITNNFKQFGIRYLQLVD